MANKKPLTKEFTEEQKAIFALGRNERDMFIRALQKTNRRAFDEFQEADDRYRKQIFGRDAEIAGLRSEIAALKSRNTDLQDTIKAMKNVNNECISRIAEALINEPVLSNLEGTCVPTKLLRLVVTYLENRGGYSKGLATKIKNQVKSVHKDIEKAVADLKRNQDEDLAGRRELGLEE